MPRWKKVLLGVATARVVPGLVLLFVEGGGASDAPDPATNPGLFTGLKKGRALECSPPAPDHPCR